MNDQNSSQASQALNQRAQQVMEQGGFQPPEAHPGTPQFVLLALSRPPKAPEDWSPEDNLTQATMPGDKALDLWGGVASGEDPLHDLVSEIAEGSYCLPQDLLSYRQPQKNQEQASELLASAYQDLRAP